MRYQSFFVEKLSLSGRPVPTVGGDLIVVLHESGGLDWELVHRTSEPFTIERGPYDLAMDAYYFDEVVAMEGPAILVRSDSRSLVFRGAGALNGFDDSMYAHTGDE